MTDDSIQEGPTAPYLIEGARSSRAKCKTCRKPILKDTLRLGILVEGPFGTGYMWHHIPCAARNHFAKVEEAYALPAWEDPEAPPLDLPSLEELGKLREQAESQKKARKVLPYAEHDPSGRAKCKHSGEPILKGALRVALGQEVEFGGQTRVSPFLVLPCHVAEALQEPGIVPGREVDPQELFEHLRTNSPDLEDADFAVLEAEIGPLD